MKTNKLIKLIPIVGIIALSTLQLKAQTAVGSDVTKSLTAIKVVDNKGTIKYFQSNNGITQITNTTNNKTTTTWQLGGTLTDDTYIDATGKVFGLKGISLTALSAATASGGTGYSLMVRDETTGKVEALLATSLIDAGVNETVLTADFTTTTPYETSAITGLTTVSNRISVFRNGVKLRQTGTVDWALNNGKIKFTAEAGDFYTGDVIEVQWVK